MKYLGILLTFTLAASGATFGTEKPAVFDRSLQLSKVIAGDTSEFLSPDVAFQVSVAQGDAANLVTRWAIAEGYYLYRDKSGVTQKDDTQITLGTINLPAGKEIHDEYFGATTVIDHDFQATVPIHQVTANSSVVDVVVTYQGCAYAGLCYPPVTKDFSVALNEVASRATSNTIAKDNFQSGQGRITDTLASKKRWFTVITFFGLGLLLTFTPCVLPMVPILSSIIIGQGKDISTAKAFTLSLSYVLAMAVMYTAMGVIVGLSGKNLQAWFQNPWIISTFAGLFVLLALSMFGFYELRIPVAIQSKLSAAGSNRQRGTYIGATVMGLLSALIVSPCVTAPMIGTLTYIATTGDALTGGAALLALSLGMGTPLLVVGASAGKILPKVGAWMNAVKGVFGVLLLALAVWLLDRILPTPLTLLLAGTLLIVSAIYMGALGGIGEIASGWRKLWKGLGLVLLVYGTILVIGAAAGSRSLLHPLQGIGDQRFALTSERTDLALPFQRIKGVRQLDAAVRQASKEGRLVMLDTYADWCISCKEMGAFTFSNADVQKALHGFVLLQADVTDNDEFDQELLKALELFGPSVVLFYDHKGNEWRDYRVVGFVRAARFTTHIENFRQAVTSPRSP